jgi:hypothetical protein
MCYNNCCRSKKECVDIVNTYLQTYALLNSSNNLITNFENNNILFSYTNNGKSIVTEESIRTIANSMLKKYGCSYTIPTPIEKAISAVITDVCYVENSDPDPFEIKVSGTVFNSDYLLSSLYIQIFVQLEGFGIYSFSTPTALSPDPFTIKVQLLGFTSGSSINVILNIATTPGMGSSIIFTTAIKNLQLNKECPTL